MTKSIKTLTEAQAAQMPAWRDRWIKIGLSCDPMTARDQRESEAAIRGLYKKAGLEAPKVVIFVPSPLALRCAAGIAGGAIFATRHGFPKRSAVGSAVDSAVRSAVRSAVGSAVSDEVRFLLLCADNASWLEWGGNLWPGYMAYLTFFRDVCGLEIEAMEAFAEYEVMYSRGGFFSMHHDFVMISDRPSHIHRDAAGQLHCETGSAIGFRDGWELFFWHGMRIPESHHWIISHKDRISPETIELERNAELRRIMLEIYGFDRYGAARQARVVAEDELHGFPRRLLEFSVSGEPVRVIEVTNGSLEPDGSRRRFHLGAMPGATPAEVVAASYGIDPRRYREAVRS